jgi:hypothetical protein
MSKIIIGIDPDSKAHGVAVYYSGQLRILDSKCLMDIYTFLDESIISHAINNEMEVEVHMEDVCANNAIFRGGNNLKVQQSIARRLGMVQQSQVELEGLFLYWDIKVVKHKISKMWKKDKAQFERVTGWKGRSNEDTRSASWFGYLGLSK